MRAEQARRRPVAAAGFAVFFAAAAISASAATFSVTAVGDGAGPCDAHCTLREALAAADALAGRDTVRFAIPGPPPYTIATIGLAATDSVVIDARTQPEWMGAPVVRLVGKPSNSPLGRATTGVRLAGSASELAGLAIGGFDIGVHLEGFGSLLRGCFIGLETNGWHALPNGTGVLVTAGAARIGGASYPERNVISANRGAGVRIAAGTAVIIGNVIGLNFDGDSARGNGGAGIELAFGSESRVGGPASGEGNVIAGNRGDGIRIDVDAGGAVVAGNLIGTDATATRALGNGGDGIRVVAAGNVIGGAGPGEGNIVVANTGAGIRLQSSAAMENRVEGNSIGTDASGGRALGNAGDGVVLEGAVNDMVGGGCETCGNRISANGGAGVRLAGASASAVWGNVIGSWGFGNQGPGIFVESATSSFLGGPPSATGGNSIEGNAGGGIVVLGGERVLLRPDGLSANSQRNIDLGGDGRTENDPGDNDSGPNGLQNYPTLFSAVDANGTTLVQGVLSSTAERPYRVDIYSSQSCSDGNPQGLGWIGAAYVTTGASGHSTFSITLSRQPDARFLTSTATDGMWNTSELSPCVLAGPEGVADLTVSVNAPQSARLGEPIEWLLQAFNSGPQTAHGVALSLELPKGATFGKLPLSCRREQSRAVCRTGDLAWGETVQITLDGSARETGELTVRAEASAIEQDPEPGDNTETAVTLIEE